MLSVRLGLNAANRYKCEDIAKGEETFFSGQIARYTALTR